MTWSRDTITSNGTSPTSASSIIYYDNSSFMSGAGTKVRVENNNLDKRIISPKAYFSLIKSKLQISDKVILKRKLTKLSRIVSQLELDGQQIAFENFAAILAGVVKELEAQAAGYERYVESNTINLFKKVQGLSKVVYFKPFEDFPRVIPAEVSTALKKAKDLGIFDRYWVLYLDYTHEKLTTNKEKIREKDPILFGQFSFMRNKFFYITDWIDERCDLTLEKFIDILELEADIQPMHRSKEPTKAYLDSIVDTVRIQQARLDSTTSRNYKQLMAEEEENKTAKKPWWKFW